MPQQSPDPQVSTPAASPLLALHRPGGPGNMAQQSLESRHLAKKQRIAFISFMQTRPKNAHVRKVAFPWKLSHPLHFPLEQICREKTTQQFAKVSEAGGSRQCSLSTYLASSCAGDLTLAARGPDGGGFLAYLLCLRGGEGQPLPSSHLPSEGEAQTTDGIIYQLYFGSHDILGVFRSHLAYKYHIGQKLGSLILSRRPRGAWAFDELRRYHTRPS